jgi:hypothetical protein
LVLRSSLAIRAEHAKATSRPPPRQTPWIAATTGTRRFSSRLRPSWPLRLRAAASAAVLHASSILMSAPARKESFLPEAKTTPFTSLRESSSAKTASNSSTKVSLRVLTGSPGTSM